MINGADTAWILTSTALVLFMTLPGLALFYAGLVRARNILSVLMQCFAIACLASFLWLICGYSLAFADGTSLIGGLGKAFLAGIARDAVVDGTGLPESIFSRAISVSAWAPINSALHSRPEGSVTTNSSPPEITCSLVTT